jgi:hypothetical protein
MAKNTGESYTNPSIKPPPTRLQTMADARAEAIRRVPDYAFHQVAKRYSTAIVSNTGIVVVI